MDGELHKYSICAIANFRRRWKIQTMTVLELSEVVQPVPTEWVLGWFRGFAQETKQDMRVQSQYLALGAYDGLERYASVVGGLSACRM